MKRRIAALTLTLALVLVSCRKTPPQLEAVAPNRVTWEVHFSPNGGCTKAAVALIDGASTSVRIQAYGFTSQTITDAVLTAKAKKRDVQAIFDSSDLTGNGSKTTIVSDAGIPTWYDDKHAIAHNKVIIVDELKTLTGSFNFTDAAEFRNAENCITLTGAQLAKVYSDNWNVHKAHSILTLPTISVPIPN
jgi:phosphatidylserine/phosphatidylglycerophosphate/cardiolipin synthase-like enzyme